MCAKAYQKLCGSKDVFLVYGLGEADSPSTFREYDEFALEIASFGSRVSFLDFDGVLVVAGLFETIHRVRGPLSQVMATPRLEYDVGDLDHRWREFSSLFEQDRPFVFLVPWLPDRVGPHLLPPHSDLFRRVTHAMEIPWTADKTPVIPLGTQITEFEDYMNRYGTARVRFALPAIDGHFTTISADAESCYAFTIEDRVFFLPCPPLSPSLDLLDLMRSAITGVRSYRLKKRTRLPDWVNLRRFVREQGMEEQREDLEATLTSIKAELQRYRDLKAVLCLRGDALATLVLDILRETLELKIQSEDECIEDASFLDERGERSGVIEVKGVNRNFTRGQIHQVNSHRERRGLSSSAPGVLIVNTMMNAKSMSEKDTPPHPDIIKAAVSNRTLLLRTFDLLRMVDLIESGKVTNEECRTALLSQTGWLTVEDDSQLVVNRGE